MATTRLPLLLAALAAGVLLAPAASAFGPGNDTGACCNSECQNCKDPAKAPFCAKDQANCELHCKGHWCDGPAPGPGPSPPGPPAPHANSSSFTVDTARAVNNVSAAFISFTIDLYNARTGFASTNFTDPAFRTAAAAFSPALVRLGGTAADNTTYDVADTADTAGVAGGKGIPPGTLARADWDRIGAFTKAAGWDMVFGLNMLKGWESSPTHGWDGTNARAFIAYTIKAGYPVVGWELGNEPNLKNKGGRTVTPSLLVQHFQSLAALLGDLYPGGTGAGTAASPWVIGPDVTHGGVAQGYMESFLDGFAPRKPIDVVTWHHYYTAGPGNPVTAAEYTNPAFLNGYSASAEEAAGTFDKYTAGRGPAAQLWMGETSGAGGACAGADQVIGKFLGVFWYVSRAVD